MTVGQLSPAPEWLMKFKIVARSTKRKHHHGRSLLLSPPFYRTPPPTVLSQCAELEWWPQFKFIRWQQCKESSLPGCDIWLFCVTCWWHMFVLLELDIQLWICDPLAVGILSHSLSVSNLNSAWPHVLVNLSASICNASNCSHVHWSLSVMFYTWSGLLCHNADAECQSQRISQLREFWITTHRSRKPFLDGARVALDTSFLVFSPVLRISHFAPTVKTMMWTRAVE